MTDSMIKQRLIPHFLPIPHKQCTRGVVWQYVLGVGIAHLLYNPYSTVQVVVNYTLLFSIEVFWVITMLHQISVLCIVYDVHGQIKIWLIH